MAARCVSAIKATTARLIKLDVCGNPVSGAGSAQVVTDGFINIDPSPQYDDGELISTRKANGEFCVYEPGDPQLTQVNLTVNWCVLDPDTITIITGDQLLSAGGLGVTGTGVAFSDGLILNRWSLEVWQLVTGEGACGDDGLQRYVYWAFPNVGGGKVGDLSFGNTALQFTNTAFTKKMGPLWPTRAGATPYLDSNTPAAGSHFLYNITTTAPPAATCGAVPHTFS